MKTTGNLGLKKPDGTDIVDITDLNGNMDILDTAVKAVQDHAADTVKHITAAERTAWNGKASTAVATTTAAGLMAAADKSKLDSVVQGANNYVHPSTHSPSIIVQDSSNRFVTDAEKTAWNGKANLVTTPQQTTADVTYYVRTDGNDGNTGLANTAGGAFRTIQKAVNMLPQTISHVAAINIASGNYSENIVIRGFNFGSNGGLTITGDPANPATVTISSMELHSNFGQVTIESLTATTVSKDAFIVNRCTGFRLNNLRVVASTGSFSGVMAYFSVGIINGGVFSNRILGVNVSAASTIDLIGVTGTGNAVGIGSNDGSFVTKFNCSLTGNQMEGIAGGTLTTGGVLNPWGDNTTLNRPMAEMKPLSDQLLSAGVWGKVTLKQSLYSIKNVADTVNSRFVSPETGVYLLNVRIAVSNSGAGRAAIGAFVNGNLNGLLIEQTSDASQLGLSLGGSSLLRLSAGEYVEIFVNPTQNISISPHDPYTHVSLIRVA
ncbi:hypothetical protein MHH28_18625 [Paenibacillus sp. FSL K6-1217]|uniref:hypothetical protein n=1 Tax=Paenibacillus sp. FSL K6-1217 TaxID=2921466 RepID=UPI003245D68D